MFEVITPVVLAAATPGIRRSLSKDPLYELVLFCARI